MPMQRRKRRQKEKIKNIQLKEHYDERLKQFYNTRYNNYAMIINDYKSGYDDPEIFGKVYLIP